MEVRASYERLMDEAPSFENLLIGSLSDHNLQEIDGGLLIFRISSVLRTKFSEIAKNTNNAIGAQLNKSVFILLRADRGNLRKPYGIDCLAPST